MKSATALVVALTLVVGSFAWYAARAQEVAAPAPGSDARSEVAPAPVPAPAAWPTVKPMTVVQMVDGKPVYETRTVVDSAPGAPTWTEQAPPPAGITIYGPGSPPMPAMAGAPGTFDYFISDPGPYRMPVNEKFAKLHDAERKAASFIAERAREYQATNDPAERKKIEETITGTVNNQFDARQNLRQIELDELAARLKRLRELHDERAAQRDRIVGDRVQQVLRDADGLGWGDATPGDNMFYFRTGGGPSSEDMLFKVQAAKADAARNLQGEMSTPHPVIDGAKIAVDPIEIARVRAVMEQKARREAAELRDEGLRDAEHARLDAMKEIMEANEEAKRAAEEAHDEAARQDHESKDESWEEHP